ncbi:hypothetical protein Tco_0304910 [Tanacetum coccineum]
MLKTHEKNEYAWGDKYEQMEYDLKIRDLKLEEKQKELDQALKERDDFKVKLEKPNASVLQNKVLNKQRYVSDKTSKEEKDYKAVRHYREKQNLVNQQLIDIKVIIEDWVDSDDEETDVSESQKETAFNSENSETSFENRSPNSQNSVGQESRTKGLGNKGVHFQEMDNRKTRILKFNLHHRGLLPRGLLIDHKDQEIVEFDWRQGQLSDFKEFKGGYVAFGNDSKGGRISGKGTIKTSCLDFEKVSYVEELKFNLLSVSQICDKKHNVLFTDKECLILSPKFKFVDEDLVILRAPRKNDVYSLDLKNIIPSGGITCLVAKATEDEAVLWTETWGMSTSKISTSWLKAIWLGVYLQRHSSLITLVWHVERVNSTGHLARRLRKELSENLLNCSTWTYLTVSVESLEKGYGHKVETIRCVLERVQESTMIEFVQEAIKSDIALARNSTAKMVIAKKESASY